MEAHQLCYELINVNPLPVVNVTRSIKSVLLAKNAVVKLNRIMRRLYVALSVAQALAILVAVAALLVPTAIGRWLAVLQFCLQLPMFLMGVYALRVDLLRCVILTYEFWFFSAVNIVNCIGLAEYLEDQRMVMLITYWLGVQMSICVDANLQARQIASGSFAGILSQLALLVTIVFEVTLGTHTHTVIKYNGRRITTADYLVNSIVNILILNIRSAYRKRKYLKRNPDKSGEIRCVSYRCRVKLQLQRVHQREMAHFDTSKTLETRIAAITTSKQSLRFVRNGVVFYDCDTVCHGILGFFVNTRPQALVRRRLGLQTLGISGILLVAFVFNYRRYSVSVTFIDSSLTILSCTGLACVICFVGVSANCLNQGIPRELPGTFDFGFISIQVSLAHLCACDILCWDERCLVLCASWLATHWVLTLDALTPAMRQRLGFRVRVFVTPALILVVSIIFSISYDLVFYASTMKIQDRVLVNISISKHALEFCVVPIFLGRVLTILLWSLRILWRVVTNGEDGMLILHGNANFIASREALGRFSSGIQPTATIQRILVKARTLPPHFRVHPRNSSS